MTEKRQYRSRVADYAHAGYPIFASDDDRLAAPYAEGFYDHCIVFWVEAGYDETEVVETVQAAVAELKATYSN